MVLRNTQRNIRRENLIGKIRNISGQRFGKLVATEIDEEKCKKHPQIRSKYWRCKCDCGNYTTVNISNLITGTTSSCGCLRREFEDLTGQRFGKLTVLSLGQILTKTKIKDGKTYEVNFRTWNCQCECGNIKKNTLEKSLKKGLVTSCGCKKIETVYQNAQKRKVLNLYDLSGDYGIGYSSNGKKFIFDLFMYEKIKDIHWIVKSDRYVEGKDNNGNYISLHRTVLNNPNCHVDHINHNPSDNRLCNLRLATREQNQANTKTRIDNTSGVKGVYYDKNKNRWMTSLQVEHKQYTKSFINKEDAIKYRKFLEEIYQKEYSYDNSMKGKET